MKRTHLVIVFLLGFCAGLLVRVGISTAQSLPAYAISVDTVMQRFQEHQDLFLVDVREERQFARVRIPGSLNIPLFAVKTKAFLKTKPVVLVDEGYHPHQLAEVCDQLTQAGFAAHFLFGGLNAWRTRSATRRWASPSEWRPSGSMPTTRTVLPLHGDVFAQKALNTMPPRAVFAEREEKYWLLIDVSANPLPREEVHPPVPPQGGNTHSQPPSTGRKTGLPDNAVDVSPGSADILSASDAGETPALPGGGIFSQVRSVPFDCDNSELFLTHIGHAVADAVARSEIFLILIYNQHGEDYEEIERVLQETQIVPVFFLTGGIEAYKQFVTQQTQIKQEQQQVFTTSCKPCAR